MTDVKEILRYMLLPTDLDKETETVDAIKEILKKSGLAETDYKNWIQIKYESWRSGEKVDTTLKQIITKSLGVSKTSAATDFSDKYFQIHVFLLEQPFIQFDTAILLLSHLRLIATFAVKERMSSTKIRNVLVSMDSRLEVVSWKDVQGILRILKILPELDQGKVNTLYKDETESEEQYFADASMDEAASQVGMVAEKLQFPHAAAALLKKLATGDSVHFPYLQILHYQCIIGAFYDHVYSAVYEFSPRGRVATSIVNKWNNLLATGNPFLNNAKAVDVLNESWATSRKTGEYEAAYVLVTLLNGLDGMGFAAAQELSSWIRKFIIRFIRINSTPLIPIADLDAATIKKILDQIAKEPTNTFGVLEQRFVDGLSAGLYDKAGGWRDRGLGDSVNSNNLSKKKLGDCDFQNSNSKEIIAFEAHGGILSSVYVEGHIRTLTRALQARKEELESIADLPEWKIKIVFVAYAFKESLPKETNIGLANVAIEYWTFKELIEKCDQGAEGFSDLFNSHFTRVINDRRTPQFVRQKITNLMK